MQPAASSCDSRRRLCDVPEADRFRAVFATRCAWPPEINAARTYAATKRSSALLTAALRRQRSHVRIVSGAPVTFRPVVWSRLCKMARDQLDCEVEEVALVEASG